MKGGEKNWGTYLHWDASSDKSNPFYAFIWRSEPLSMHRSFSLLSAPGNTCYSTCSGSVPPPWLQTLPNPPGFSSVQFGRWWDTRPLCPSPTLRVYSNSCPPSRWCHQNISSSVVPFSSRLQSFPASGSFQMSQFFTSGGQSIGLSAWKSVLPMNMQDWFSLGWTGWIFLQSKGL